MKIIIFIITILISIQVFSQDILKKQECIPAPNSALLGTYGDVPISYFSGKANISIPIVKENQRGIELDVNLSYDTGGVIANTLPTWTGYNWTLNAGGVITRERVLHDDERTVSRTYTQYKNYFQKPDGLREYETNHCENDVIKRSTANGILMGDYDVGPDIFHFNFMGKSGKFYLDMDGIWRVSSKDNLKVIFDVNDESMYTYPYFKYCHPNNKSVPLAKTIKGFTLIDEEGIKYIFGDNGRHKDCTSLYNERAEAIEYSIPFFDDNNNKVKETLGKKGVPETYSATAWYLTEVRDRFDNILYSFEYNRGSFLVQIYYGDIKDAMSDYENEDFSTTPCFEDTKDFPYTLSLNSPVYLKSIKMPLANKKISFEQDSSYILDAYDFYQSFYMHRMGFKYPNDFNSYLYTLNNLEGYSDSMSKLLKFYVNEVQKRSSEPVGSTFPEKVFSLMQYDEYSKFWNPKVRQRFCNRTEEEIKGIRLMDPINNMSLSPLKYITVYQGNQVLNKFQLQYPTCGTDRLLLKGIDFLSKDSESVLYSYMFKYNSSHNDTRISRSDCLFDITDAWGYFDGHRCYDYLLSDIVYPTGGVTSFSYSPNKCTKIRTFDPYNYMEKLDHEMIVGGVRVNRITNFENIAKNKILSERKYDYKDGQLSARPTKRLEIAKGLTLYMSKSFIPLTYPGGHIGYSYVIEHTSDIDSTVFEFSNFDDYYDLVGVPCSLPSLDTYGRRDYYRGKMLEKRVFKGNELMARSRYEYCKPEESKYSFYNATYSTVLQGQGDNSDTYYVRYYNLFYPKYDVIKEYNIDRYGTNYVGTITEYQKEDFINENDNSICRMTTGITEYRLKAINGAIPNSRDTVSDVLITEYSYPRSNSGHAQDSSLLKQHFYPVLETKKYINGTFIEGKKNEYGVFSNSHGLYLPSKELEYSIDGKKTRVVKEYLSYSDKMKPTKYIEEGQVCDILWNKNDQATELSVNNKDGYNKFSFDPVSTIHAEYNESGNVSSILKDNSIITYYNYDEYGRLSTIKDLNNKTLNTYNYNYKPFQDISKMPKTQNEYIKPKPFATNYTNNLEAELENNKLTLYYRYKNSFERIGKSKIAIMKRDISKNVSTYNGVLYKTLDLHYDDNQSFYKLELDISTFDKKNCEYQIFLYEVKDDNGSFVMKNIVDSYCITNEQINK